MTSRGASLVPSHAASRTASPVFSAGSEDASLPVVLCNLLQREFSPRRSSFDGRASGRGNRRRGEEQEEDVVGKGALNLNLGVFHVFTRSDIKDFFCEHGGQQAYFREFF